MNPMVTNQAQYLWNKLSEPLRWANRYQLDAYSVFCRTLGYGIRRSDHSPAHISESMFNEDLRSTDGMPSVRWPVGNVLR